MQTEDPMMGDKTGISWTDHTFNPWWGCTKIARGCDNCYAATLDKRTGGDYWDVNQKPRRTSKTNWRKVLTWHNQAVKENRRHRVFCGSMMDWCDKDAPEGALTDLFELIKTTPMLDWQLLTKRATLIKHRLPDDWGTGYDNVWLGVTVEDQEYGKPRIDALRNIPAKVRFISAEPLLEDLGDICLANIDWCIIGGESGPGFRAMKEDWAIKLALYCKSFSVAIWFKQHGGNSRDKGGDMLGGREFKNWPRSAV